MQKNAFFHFFKYVVFWPKNEISEKIYLGFKKLKNAPHEAMS